MPPGSTLTTPASIAGIYRNTMNDTQGGLKAGKHHDLPFGVDDRDDDLKVLDDIAATVSTGREGRYAAVTMTMHRDGSVSLKLAINSALQQEDRDAADQLLAALRRGAQETELLGTVKCYGKWMEPQYEFRDYNGIRQHYRSMVDEGRKGPEDGSVASYLDVMFRDLREALSQPPEERTEQVDGILFLAYQLSECYHLYRLRGTPRTSNRSEKFGGLQHPSAGYAAGDGYEGRGLKFLPRVFSFAA
ncbi:hypothetical protein OE88DRAFT_1729718 [Heliocybe sulcata]|uniref:Uncharacterized protein n=1 Tax=Heliocybe sulcata TaxID=5364 RepID=A0A5C3MJ42_9AGAM|nr:hypothetical protein OE88DRAFT_1729718 [Heliocybe sulcata]